MKSSDELNKEEGKKIKTTELWVKKCKCIESILFFFNKYKMFELVLKNTLITKFTQ